MVAPEYAVVAVRALAGFADECARHYPGIGLLPIARHRALAQSLNPLAQPDDAALVVARQGTKIVGYLGLVPGALNTPSGRAPISYLSTWLVADEARGSGVGPGLVAQAMKLVDLVGTGSSRLAIARFLKMGFVSPILEHHRLNCGVFNVVGARNEAVSRVLQPAARFAFFAGARSRLTCSPGLPVDAAVVAAPYAFDRPMSVLRWMMSHPWVLPVSAQRSPDEHYRFSSYRDSFDYRPISIFRDGICVGWAIYSVSRNRGKTTIKLLDHVLPAELFSDFGDLMVERAAAGGADAMELPAPVARAWSAGWRALGLRQVERPYFCHPKTPDSPLAMALPHLRLDYVDADMAFA